MKKLVAGLFMCVVVLAAATYGTVTMLISNVTQDSSAISAEVLTNSQTTQVQTKLKNLGLYTGKIDGIYGSQTRAAVRKFQQANGLKVDGIVGPQTAAKLGISLGNTSTSNSDLYLLAKCIYAEARGEPYTGQVAVGAVILNRVKNSQFPNSIAGVIYQPLAFTCVADGQINLEPNQNAYNAARDALNGWDPTYGCLYYYNPATATSSWIWSLKVTLKIGKHSFAQGK